jgi:hypothetical protein
LKEFRIKLEKILKEKNEIITKNFIIMNEMNGVCSENYLAFNKDLIQIRIDNFINIGEIEELKIGKLMDY